MNNLGRSGTAGSSFIFREAIMAMDRSSRNRLTERLLPQFAGATLFDAIARAACRAGCLPRKELYEAWEVARRVRRRFRGGRVVDLACGHGLLAQILLLLDDSSPAALAIDRRLPPAPPPLLPHCARTGRACTTGSAWSRRILPTCRCKARTWSSRRTPVAA
jgi:hypothetical protein